MHFQKPANQKPETNCSFSFRLILITIFLASCTSPQEEPGFLGERLAACTAEYSPFEEDVPLQDWATFYHQTTDDVIEAHLDALERIGLQKLRCDAPTLAGVVPPSQELRGLATLLPPWQSDERLAGLSELHAGSVLLEFLRVYECANLERSWDLREYIDASERGPYIDETLKQQEQIASELNTSRLSLERTLDVVGSLDQFRAVSIELECLKRSSLDLRNALSLIADASACMTKIPGKSSLRDPPDLPFAQ